MVQTATESFCERCGTRYAFEAPRPAKRGLGRSLARAVLGPSDDEAFAEAHAHDPFLGTFRFCLECRQYTCPQCWNEEAGFCATCVPFPDAPPIDVVSVSETEAMVVEERPVLGAETWPTTDLAPDDDGVATTVLDETDARAVERIAAMLKTLDDESDVAERREQSTIEATLAFDVAAAEDRSGDEPASLADVVDTVEVAPETDTLSRIVATPAATEAALAATIGEPDLALELAWNHLLLSTPTGSASDAEPAEDWSSAFDAPSSGSPDTAAVSDLVAPDAITVSQVDVVPAEAGIATRAAGVVPEVDAVPPATDLAPADEPAARTKSRSLLSRFRTIRPAAELVDDADAAADAVAELDQVAELEPVAAVEPVAETAAIAESRIEAIEPVVAAAAGEPERQPDLVLTLPDAAAVVEITPEPADEMLVDTAVLVEPDVAGVESVAVAEPEPARDAAVLDEAEAQPALVETETQPALVTDAAPEPVAETETELVADDVPELVAEAQADLVAEVQLEADVVEDEPVLAVPEIVAAETTPGPTVVAEPVVEIAAVVTPEAVDAPPVDVPVELAADAEPTIAPVPAPPAPAPSAPQASPPPVPQAPTPRTPPPPPVAPALPGWQLTAPDDLPARPETPATVWPPLGPVYRPPADRPRGLEAPTAPIAAPPAFQVPKPPQTPPYAAATAAPAPSMLARGQAPSGHAASGIRPCGSCELPLSASARFCRRCGSRQG